MLQQGWVINFQVRRLGLAPGWKFSPEYLAPALGGLGRVESRGCQRFPGQQAAAAERPPLPPLQPETWN